MNEQMGQSREERASVLLWPYCFPHPSCIIYKDGAFLGRQGASYHSNHRSMEATSVLFPSKYIYVYIYIKELNVMKYSCEIKASILYN